MSPPLDRLAALNPAIVVSGDKKPGAPGSPSAIALSIQMLPQIAA
jgi:hypothetical protein